MKKPKFSGCILKEEKKSHEGMSNMTQIQVIAHRGASRAERENTLDAFRRAGVVGADAVELDVRRTRDGAMAVHHDAVLPNGRLICEITALELPTHVPLLPDALDACGGMWVNIEIKNHPLDADFDESDRLAATIAEHLADRGDDHRWLISAFHLPTVDAMRTLRPEVRTAWLTDGVRDENLERVARDLAGFGHSALHPYTKFLNQRCIEVFHSHGLQVNSWTIDDPARMAEVISWGIDGICTNVPDVAIQVRDAQ
jgi:glycerophosphoryl diester phosphodiesterase